MKNRGEFELGMIDLEKQTTEQTSGGIKRVAASHGRGVSLGSLDSQKAAMGVSGVDSDEDITSGNEGVLSQWIAVGLPEDPGHDEAVEIWRVTFWAQSLERHPSESGVGFGARGKGDCSWVIDGLALGPPEGIGKLLVGQSMTGQVGWGPGGKAGDLGVERNELLSWLACWHCGNKI